jgi:D-apionolactonase
MDLITLYGTDKPPRRNEVLRAGDATVTLEAGQLRHLRVGGTEAIRAVSFLVRDRDWGTVDPVISELAMKGGHVAYSARYDMDGGHLDVQVTLTLTPNSLTAEVVATAHGTIETNRAGFTVLHPIEGVAGASVRVGHPDGSGEETRFPALIEPWQPFKDIAALTHEAGGLRIECRLEGDVFEMEDQRQWGDASYKTYNRPLALPWPYTIRDGAELRQAVRIAWSPIPASDPVPPIRAEVAKARFPQTALVLTAEDARHATINPDDLRRIGAQRVLCHLDIAAGHGLAELQAFAALQAVLPDLSYDLELIAACRPDCDLKAEFAGYAADLAALGFRPASIMTCPSVDRQSTPPGSDWPPCPPLEAIHAAARAAFPDITLGGGMASFFPELNRKRPPADAWDFVTHGLCPIVHAADDLSVMETLEAVPHILASARAIIGGRDYRLGPSTIAMRQNPYGSRTIPNPDRDRVCMADDDPRQDAAFAAAWTLGLAAAIAPAGVTVWTPGALYGPRGLVRDDGSLRPLAGVVQALAAQAGQPMRGATVADGRAELAFDGATLTANLTPERPDPFGWQNRPPSPKS